MRAALFLVLLLGAAPALAGEADFELSRRTGEADKVWPGDAASVRITAAETGCASPVS